MNYYDSESYKIFSEFKFELDKLLYEENFRSNYIAKQIERGTLYYKYSKRILLSLADKDSALKASQDILLEFTKFAVTLGERAGEVSD